MSSQVEGSLEAVIDGRAIGWAWDPEDPERALEVEVLVDGKPIVAAIAEVERLVLAEAGIGTGRYGFDIALPEQLGGKAKYEIQVEAGPGRQILHPFEGFETVTRFPDGPWGETEFVAIGAVQRDEAYVPEEEDRHDPGEAALVGKEGWLFVHDESKLERGRLTGAEAPATEDIEGRGEALAEQYRGVRGLRIPYLLATVPMKERFYAKKLPDGLALHPQPLIPRLNRALRAISGSEVLDLQPALKQGNRGGPVFPKTDSNWSDRGAFFAYGEVMFEAAKRVVDLGEPLSFEEARFAARKFRGDLAAKPKVEFRDGEFAAVEDEREWEEEIEFADVSRLRSLRMPAPEHLEVTDGRAPHLYEIPEDPSLPRAVLVGDSCCLALIQWLAEHFRRFVFLWSEGELPLEAIELEAPDLVIHVVSERLLVRGL